jgi:hypothetical protein
MKRRALIALASFVALGLLSGFVSIRSAERAANAEITAHWRAVGGGSIATLQPSQVGRVPIAKDLQEYALTGGAFGPWLVREWQFLPLGVPPETWTCVRGRLVGPFLVVVDLDATESHGSGAHIFIGRTLHLAVFGWSGRISSWGTGASYSGVGRRLTPR